MIVSHARKFIFVKTRKTSGTSMEISLSTVCGPDDIITPISWEDELVRLDMGGRLPQNYGGRNEDGYRAMIKSLADANPGDTFLAAQLKDAEEMIKRHSAMEALHRQQQEQQQGGAASTKPNSP